MKPRLATLLLVLLCASCSSKKTGSDCDPGDTRPCTCPGDLSGEQTCEEDGWGACDCSGEDAGADAEDVVTPDADDPGDPETDPAGDAVEDVVDDGPPCDETPCGLIPNCGCPTGQKCSVTGTTHERQCVDAGTGTAAEPCERDDECEAETFCARMFSPAGADEAICFGFCRDEGDCPGDASICLRGLAPETVGYCTIGCDLLTSEPCPDGSKCKWLRTTTDVDYTDCIADVGAGLMGSSCTGEDQCAPGYFCSGSTTCIGYCRISPAPDTCTFGCSQFSISGSPVDLVFDGVSYGYCWP